MVPDYVSQQHTSGHQNYTLYTIYSRVNEAIWVLLLWQADYGGRSGSCDHSLVC